jgi:tetratricopeptide (TPR) repeat protein
LLKDVAEGFAEHPDFPFPLSVPRDDAQGMDYLPHWKDAISTLSFFVSQRCTSFEFVDEFLTALESVDALLRERILRGFVGGGVEAQMAIDRVWLAESDKDNPNWERCLTLFERALMLGRTWSCIPLAGAASRGISTVLDEYVKDHGRAHQALNRLGSTGDLPLHVLHDRRACVFFSEEKYLDAEEEWKRALASWPRKLAPFDSGAAFAARSAGLCAARLKRWREAANWFKEIVVRVPTKSEVAMIAGANGDAGYCFWKGGMKADAVAALIDAWELASTLPSGRENLRAFIRRKCIGHVIAWLYGQVRDEGLKMDEPIAGACSSGEMPEKMSELPETDNANVWLLLIEIERKLGTGNRAAQLGGRDLAETGNPITKSISLMQVVAENLQTGKLDTLPQDLIRWATALNQAIAFSPAEWPSQTKVEPMVFQRNDAAGGACAFIAGLVSAHGHGQNWRDLVRKWRAALPADAGEGWLEWFDTIELILGGSTSTAARLVREKKDWPTSMLAAWHLLISSEATPDDIFYGHARWLGEIRTSRWLSETAGAFCQQVEVAWGTAILTPALLRLPNLSIANIRAALVSGSRGMSRAARILLSASTAVSVRLGPTEAFIRNLTEGE